MTTGRPTTFDRLVFDAACDRMTAGETLRDIARDPAMPAESTIRSWAMREDPPGLFAQYKRAREALAHHWADETMEIADDGSNDWIERRKKDGTVEVVLDREHVERSKLRVGQRNWMLSRLLPRDYGDRVQTQQLGADGAPVDPVAPIVHIDLGAALSGWIPKDK